MIDHKLSSYIAMSLHTTYSTTTTTTSNIAAKARTELTTGRRTSSSIINELASYQRTN